MTPPRIVVATANLGKIAEIRAMVEGADIEIVPLAVVGTSVTVVEDGDTFEANALIKAGAVAAACGLPTLADDSGLEVDALGGRPGVHSARYGGEGLDDFDRCQRLLTELFGAPPELRTARFRCAIAYLEPPEPPVTFHGTLEGRIALRPAGTHGFGYDPIFLPQGFQETLAELPPVVKNTISHRFHALEALRLWLRAR
ncbi:MAG TPA: RdgB/HAM1 family non-canonical purine NTP pyrophosphatase [Polyangia bacterium]|nr:RdgB/HAM1 family non-canonical purine NTP pyrophosphatase [Polyangia bacterium]